MNSLLEVRPLCWRLWGFGEVLVEMGAWWNCESLLYFLMVEWRGADERDVGSMIELVKNGVENSDWQFSGGILTPPAEGPCLSSVDGVSHSH